ncbi:SusE-like outer membrane protein [Flavobacterium cutihirudinis]|uniref:SusE-like outer membrane protein n=1 Tax=Flavobacterium cutihirudinis TaxID=1265740 RepID=A0A3D9FWH9_9FLAO|nr:hypothetical protein [Flavobacterium cutihirudinis]RED25100.1 SusE-like outer membrane protein [Flavobacterium cutihirudinis]
MKNFIYLSIAGLIFASCSSGGDDPEPAPANTAPSVPELVSPADNKLCLDNAVVFQWFGSTDPEKDQVSYEIQVAKDNAFAQIVQTLTNSSLSTNVTLEKNTAYYWRVKASDSKGLASAYSATFKFYTSGEAVVNHLPFAPELVSPAINTSLSATTTTLKWNASDVDTADTLTYDVYFGTANPPTQKISENKSEKNVDVTTEAGKQYFWKVVVKDNKGGETVGQVWKFKTN